MLAAACGRIGYDDPLSLNVDPILSDGAAPDVYASEPAESSSDVGSYDAPILDAASDDAAKSPTGDALNVQGLYIEAEVGLLSGGFTVESDPTASQGHYIAPPSDADADVGSASAVYAFSIATPGTYVAWGRIHSPDVIHNRFLIQVDGGTPFVWRISTGDVWYWDAFHDDTRYRHPLTFDLAAGAHELRIFNLVDGVGLDRIYFTASGDVPPGNDTTCDPPNSILVGGTCALSCGSQRGTSCDPYACMGLPQVPAYDCAVCCIRP